MVLDRGEALVVVSARPQAVEFSVHDGQGEVMAVELGVDAAEAHALHVLELVRLCRRHTATIRKVAERPR